MNEISRISDMFSLTLDHGEATYLSREEATARKQRVERAYSADGVARLKSVLDDFIGEARELTALDFYLAFEQASLLVLLHAFPRPGERNRHANGLQQTYGDHIRLMMLGFDRYDQSDVDWLMSRRWRDPLDVDLAGIEASVALYHSLKLNRSERAAIWIAAALHDYGKLFRRGYGLDAEDAAPLCATLIEALSPVGMSELIHYGVRNHDLIEHTVTGDTPACFITEPLAELPGHVRHRALPMLALIQQIGAASLGEGRLAKAKLDIYNACLAGDIVDDESVEARLGRLLFGPQAVPEPAAKARAGEILARLGDADRAGLLALLDRTVVLGWKAVRKEIQWEAGERDATARLVAALLLIGKLWSQASGPPAHVVLARPKELVKRIGGGARPGADDVTTALLNGTSALILR